jgi:hypothetical protein
MEAAVEAPVSEDYVIQEPSHPWQVHKDATCTTIDTVASLLTPNICHLTIFFSGLNGFVLGVSGKAGGTNQVSN